MGTTADRLAYLNATKGLLKDSINNRGGNITDETPFRNYVAEFDGTKIDYTDPDSVYVNTRPAWWMEVPIPTRDNSIYLLLHCDPDESAIFSGNIQFPVGETLTVDLGYIENEEFIIQTTTVYPRGTVAPFVFIDVPNSVGILSAEHNIRQVLCHSYTTNNGDITYWKISGTSWVYPCSELVEIKARYDHMGQQVLGSSYGVTTNAWTIPYANLVYYQEYGTHFDPDARNAAAGAYAWQNGVFGGLDNLILVRLNFQLTVWNESFMEDKSLVCIYPPPGRPTRGGRSSWNQCVNLRLDYWDLSNFDCTLLGTSEGTFRQTRLREFTGILCGSLSATFYYCRYLKSITADCAALTAYNANAFLGCLALKSLHLTNMSTSWGANIDLRGSSMTASAINSFADDLPTLVTTRALILSNTMASITLSDGSPESLAILQKITDKNWTVTL